MIHCVKSDGQRNNTHCRFGSLIRFTALIAVIVVGFHPLSVSAQETYFGKNKVVYRTFEWRFIQSTHFDIYFYDDQYTLAKYTAEAMEEALEVIEPQLDYTLKSRIPVFIYLSANDMQTTNITSGLLPENVNGFTEAFKKRVVVHFNGSYADYRHLLHHELTHAVVYDMIFGGAFSSIISRQRLFNLPLWFAEGFAEYSSRDHWHYRSDMIVRDATITGYLRPPGRMGILAYTEGAMLVSYIVDTYGEEKLGEILRKGKVFLSMNRAIKGALGLPMEKLWADYQLSLKQRYWPEIVDRKQPGQIAKALTHHGKDGSFFNEKPEFSPNGDVIAIFSDRADYTEIFLISAEDGHEVKKVTKASRSGDLESLHSYFSGITFSPDGENICFVAKSNGYDALFFMHIRDKKTYLKRRIEANGLLSPIWSPDGKRVAFSALMHGQRDLFVYDIGQDVITALTNDLHDDQDASWTKDSKSLIFTSDRQHPENDEDRDVRVDLTGIFDDENGEALRYGAYNLFRINLESLQIEPLAVGVGNNKEPAVSPDGKKIVFVSNRSGIDNLYLHYLDSTGAIAITDLLTGVGSPSWEPGGKKIAFSSFNKGGYDIFLLNEIVPAGDNGSVELTSYYQGKFDKDYVELAEAETTRHSDAPIWSPEKLGWATPDDTVSLVSAGSAATVIDTSHITSEGDFVFVSNSKEKSGDSAGDPGKETDGDEDMDDDESAGADDSLSIADDPFAPNSDPLNPLLTDVPDEDLSTRRGALDRRKEMELITGNRSGKEYVIRPYKVRFTPDVVAGGLNYDSFFGVRSQGFFLFSDYLGNHQIFLGVDISGNIDQSNLQAYYFDNTRRTRLGGGLFHSKNFYRENILDGSSNVFSDRFYGFQGFASYPFSVFSRVDFGAAFTLVDRRYHELTDPRRARSTKAVIADGAYTHDNVLWGFTGPVNGSRSKITFSIAKDFFNSEHRIFLDSMTLFDSPSNIPYPIPSNIDSTVSGLEYFAAEVDHRRYWHMGGQFSAAFRVAGGLSGGATPKRYFMGGTTNWLGNRISNATAYEVENLYFSDVVTPLRGYDFYELSGSRYFLTNIEFRYPFIDYLQLHFPLPITLAYIQGATFFDIGAAWDGSNLNLATNQGGFRLQDAKAGFGWGLRANLGFFLLRYDMAWATDFAGTSKPRSYFSFGADF